MPALYLRDLFSVGGFGTVPLQDSPAITGASWVKIGGGNDALKAPFNGGLFGDGGSGSAIYYSDSVPESNEYDITFSVKITSETTSGDRHYVYGRLATDGSTYYAAAVDAWDNIIAGKANHLRLSLLRNGSVIGTPYTLDDAQTNQTYTIKFELRNASKKIYLDGIERVSSTDNTVTNAGYAGVKANNQFEKFKLLDINGDIQAFGNATLPLLSLTSADTNLLIPVPELDAQMTGTYIFLPVPILEAGMDGIDATLPLPVVDGGTNDALLALPVLELDAEGSNDEASVTLPAPTLTAAVDNGLVGVINVPRLINDVVGLPGGVGNGVIDLPAPITVGDTGSGASLIVPATTLDAVALSGTTSNSEITTPLPIVNGVALGERIGIVDTALPIPSVGGFVITGAAGSAHVRLAKAILAAEGIAGNIGTAEINAPVFSIGATGYPAYIGTAQLFIPMATVEIVARSQLPTPTKAYAMNLRHSGVTEYSNYVFNSFASFNGEVLAAGPNGIFALSGNTDGDNQIDAHATLGRMAFGSEQLKRVRELFVSYRSNGPMRLTAILEDGSPHIYTLEARAKQGLRNSRAKIGRALKSKYWQFKIGNTDGYDFSVDTMSIDPQELTRKLG